jgi:HEAT repeat protein
MKRFGIVLAIGLCALPAQGDQTQLANEIKHALTPIDSLPSRAEIEIILGGTNTVQQLSALAQSAEDFGVRLRAIRALPQFCPTACFGAPPHAALVTLLDSLPPEAQDGKTILLRRATIEAIGITRTGDSEDVNLLLPFLNSPSRDIRAATAFALRDLCNQSAVVPLRARHIEEMKPTGVPQVALAISVALRDLDTCSL